MTIEIQKSLVLREPQIREGNGHQPLVAYCRPEMPGVNQMMEKLHDAVSHVATYQVVDGRGPCYEFQGIASVKNDFLTIDPFDSLRPLR